MNKIIIRKYNKDDANKIRIMTEDAYYKIFSGFSENTIELILIDDTPVGWIYSVIPENPLYSGFVFIYVAPNYRRKGIGTYAYKRIESRLNTIGCNWWSSYPEFKVADKFAVSVGFDFTGTNSYLVHNGNIVEANTDGIRVCRIEDYPRAPDIWSKEYEDMHIRMGLPYKHKELSDEEREEEYNEFKENINNYFVIEDDNIIVGVGSLFDDNSGIGSLAVDSLYSGRGYGTRLAAFMTNECIRRGCQNPCIYCETENNNALHIYKKIGYSEQYRESVALKN